MRKEIGIIFVLDKGMKVYDKQKGYIRTIPITARKAYYLLLQHQYHSLSEQQEWLKRQIDASA